MLAYCKYNLQKYIVCEYRSFFSPRTCRDNIISSQLWHTKCIFLQLTFVEYFEANVGAAVISGKQEIKEVAAAK